MTRWLLLPLLLACHRPPAALGDPTLPEAVEAVETQGPEQILIDAAAHLDPTIRARALHWLVRTTSDLDTWGPRARFDPSPWVQRAAIGAFVARSPPANAELEALALQPGADPAVRALAALSLPAGSIDLTGVWRDAPAPWDRVPLALAAGFHGDADAAAALDAALRTGDLDLDLPLMDALARYGSPALLPALAVAQERAEPELGIAIATARLRLGDPQGEVVLRKALGDDTHTRMEVLDRMATWADPTADGLIRKAHSAGPDLVRLHADLLLTARTGAQASRLTDTRAAPDREVRLLGVQAAGLALRSGPASRALARTAVEVLADALTDTDPAVRAEAVHLLGDHGDRAHVTALEALLLDEVQAVRIEAAGVLSR